MTCGIYWIRNVVNDKKYIGSSDDIEERWLHHRSKLKTGKHSNTHLQRAYTKYGFENFDYIVLEECSIESLEDREDYYIELYNTIQETFGYNKKWAFGRKKNGTERKNKPMLESVKLKISNSLTGRPKSEEWKQKASRPKSKKARENISKAKLFKKYGDGSSSLYVGVYINQRRTKWISNITINTEKVYLGIFEKETEAAVAFDTAYCKYYKKEFGLNFPNQSHKEDF